MRKETNMSHRPAKSDDWPALTSMNQDRNRVAELAYELWQARGCPLGSPEDDWLRAEQQLKEGTEPEGALAA
jgi:hypothetical protein